MNSNNLKILNEKYIEDFNKALNIYENYYSHEDLINLIKNGTIVEKQTAVLKLDSINSSEEAKILMNNLTGCDGKIREAVSFRLKEFIKEKPEYYIDFSDIFIDAIVDINGNICRNTISALQYLKNNSNFCNEFCKKLEDKTLTLSEKAKTFDIQDGKYKINKEIFKLYWYLQAIYEFCDSMNTKILETILSNSKDIQDYTIREKAAKILSKLSHIDNLSFKRIQQELKNDKNYYVRRF